MGSDGAPADFSLAGPWVGVAAPGTQVISTNPYPGTPGQVDDVSTQNGRSAIQGTSFACPYVAGVAALVRSAFPDLSAAQVVRRIEQTAAHPAAPGGRNDYVGYGMVDPMAAVSAVLPDAAGISSPPARPSTLPPGPVRSKPTRPRQVALAGSGLVAGAILVLTIALQTGRLRRRRAGH